MSRRINAKLHDRLYLPFAVAFFVTLAGCSDGSELNSAGQPAPNPGPGDTAAPIISSVSVTNIVATSVTVSWTTNEASSTQVQYGISTAYGSSATDAASTTSHSAPLSGLAANTQYHYRVLSTDAANNTATSSNATFMTLAIPDTTAPSVALTAPAAGDVSGTVLVSATATDNAGGSGVAGVQFRLNDTDLGNEDTSAPYSVSWNTTALTPGTTYTLTAVARDGAGQTTTSVGVSVRISSATAGCSGAGFSTEKTNLTVPYCLDMRDDDYLRYPTGNPVAVANGNASITDEANGSFNGGHAARIVPPTTEGYAGLGNFNFIPGAVGSRMNIRYLVYWGYDAVQSGVKLNILNDGISTRPMVITREMRSGQNTTFAHDYMIPIPSQNVNESPVIRDPGYPNSPSFFIAGLSVPVTSGNYAHQWVCWEFEVISGGNAPVLNFYIHTRDGVIAYGPGNPYATHAWDAGVIDLARASAGWYWGPDWVQSGEAYVKISDVIISNTYIGPPAGFVQ